MWTYPSSPIILSLSLFLFFFEQKTKGENWKTRVKRVNLDSKTKYA